jgi:hypothetical protein
MHGFSIGGLLFALAWLVFLIVKGAGVNLQSLRQRGSQAWPWARATIEGGSVELVVRGRSRRYELMVSYSYSVNGDKYGGTYTESFGSEPEAQSALKSLQDLPPPARYKSNDPSKSVMDPYRDAALAVTSPRTETASS